MYELLTVSRSIVTDLQRLSMSGRTDAVFIVMYTQSRETVAAVKL